MKRYISTFVLALVVAATWAPAISLATSFFNVDSAGNIGIGNTDPQHKLDVSGAIYSRLATTTSSINWNAGNVQTITLSSNPTLTFSNGQAGGEYKLIIKQDGTGGRTVAWPASVIWSYAATPTLSSVANAIDMMSFVFDGTNYLGTKSFASSYTECQGGTITRSGGNTIHTFTSSGTFNCVGAGSRTAHILVIGGGGGGAGGAPSDGGGGAGGAGGFIENNSFFISAQSYSVTVGTGGAGGTGNNPGTAGSDSMFSGNTAVGGGYGGKNNGNGGNGGSGGGAGGSQTYSGGTGTSGQGSSGGSNNVAQTNFGGAGGGGAGSAGADSTATTAGAGGNGTSSSISGTSVTYAGGGGGGIYQTGSGASGGSGGGGAGGNPTANGTNGTANTGGGGGGAGGNATATGGSGGSGIVIISYPTP